MGIRDRSRCVPGIRRRRSLARTAPSVASSRRTARICASTGRYPPGGCACVRDPAFCADDFSSQVAARRFVDLADRPQRCLLRREGDAAARRSDLLVAARLEVWAGAGRGDCEVEACRDPVAPSWLGQSAWPPRSELALLRQTARELLRHPSWNLDARAGIRPCAMRTLGMCDSRALPRPGAVLVSGIG